MKKLKIEKNSGITLISLVITIILLLVLATITITQLFDSGILNNVEQAKNKADTAQKEENITLSDYENEINKVLGTRDSISEEEEALARVTQTTFTDFEIPNLDSYKFFMIYIMHSSNVIKGQMTVSLNKLKNSNETSYIEPIFYDGGFYYGLLYNDSDNIIKARVNGTSTVMEIYGVK